MSQASGKLMTYLPFAAMPARESIHPPRAAHGQMPGAILTSAGCDCHVVRPFHHFSHDGITLWQSVAHVFKVFEPFV